MQKNRIFAACAKGVSPYLGSEIRNLGFPVRFSAPAGVETEGTFDDAMLLNLYLRSAHHVLFNLKEFQCRTADDLYRGASEIPWEDIIPENGYISIYSNVDNPTIRDSRYPNLKCKDAIVDRVKKSTGDRPDAGNERDKTLVYLFWQGPKATIYIDTSGESLSMRNYRKNPYKAPMQEVLASAVILATGWKGETNFINPMCGSGTLAIEAALLALDRAPGILRTNFGFMHVKWFDRPKWDKMRKDARAKERKDIPAKIIATDISNEAVRSAHDNASNAGVEKFIHFETCDYSETPVPPAGGIVIVNPGYGIRMGDEASLEPLYKGIGDFLKQKCAGYTGYIFSGNSALLKKVGLTAKRKLPFFNADIECRLNEYELYEGTKSPG